MLPPMHAEHVERRSGRGGHALASAYTAKRGDEVPAYAAPAVPPAVIHALVGAAPPREMPARAPGAGCGGGTRRPSRPRWGACDSRRERRGLSTAMRASAAGGGGQALAPVHSGRRGHGRYIGGRPSRPASGPTLNGVVTTFRCRSCLAARRPGHEPAAQQQ